MNPQKLIKRLQDIIGAQTVQIVALQTQLEELKERDGKTQKDTPGEGPEATQS